MCSRTDCWQVQASICCDTADQKDESQRSTAETDGRGDTYCTCEKSRASRQADTWLQIKRRQKLRRRLARTRLCAIDDTVAKSTTTSPRQCVYAFMLAARREVFLAAWFWK